MHYILRKNVKVGRAFIKRFITMRTIICSDEHVLDQVDGYEYKKPKLVLVHGYGSISGKYFRLIPYLIKHFTFILIDLIGYGGSSRPNNFDSNNFTT